jgi:DNA gyrase subunit A
VIELIKGSHNPEEAKNKLIGSFSFTEIQTKAILDMRLQKLTSLETDKLIEEYDELQKQIIHYNEILSNHDLQSKIIKEELLEIREKYGDSRKTEIIPMSGTLSLEDMIAEEDMVVTISHNGYIKRLPVSTWKTQNRGGRGMKGANTKQDDYIEHLFVASTHNTMLFFTNTGKCYWLKVYQIPQASRTSQGRAIINLIGCNTQDKVKAFVSVKEFQENQNIVMCTKKGLIKRSKLSLYSKPRKGGVYAIDINQNDELIQSKITEGQQDIILATNNGKAIRFNEQQIRSTGRKTKGVKGIRMSYQDDFVIGMLTARREGQVLVVSSNGFGKRSELNAYREQKRGGKGVFTLKSNKKTGKLISILEVVAEDDLMIITNEGIMIRQPVNKLNIIGRNTQGVKLLRLDKKATIASVTKVIKEDRLEETEEGIPETPEENTEE